jgi:hypothetical protein
MPRLTVSLSSTHDLLDRLLDKGFSRAQADEVLSAIHRVHWELTEQEEGTPPMATTKQMPFTETFGAMTPVPPEFARWEVTALKDSLGNVWDILPNGRVGLRSSVGVQMKRSVAEVDYGPLTGCEVSHLDGLIEDHQVLWERYRRAKERIRELEHAATVAKAEMSDQHAVEHGPLPEEPF